MSIRLQRFHIKTKIKTFRKSEHIVLRSFYSLSRLLWRTATVLINGNARSVFFVKHFKSGETHQIYTVTRQDRYPDLFDAARQYFGAAEGLKLLSFGCSSGEEVFTLRTYFPGAHILGVDINARNIAISKKRNTDPGIEFFATGKHDFSDRAPFDAIFCLAVLQRSELREPGALNSASIYPFSKFDAQLQVLDTCLRPGGLMVIDLCSYRFVDASIVSRYRALEGSGVWRKRFVQFDRNQNRIEHPCYNERIFIKLPDKDKTPEV